MDGGRTIDPRAHRALAGVSRVRVLEYLRARAAAAPAPEIAEAVGLHPNTVRLHLEQLAEAGLVARDVEARDRPGRPRLLYRAQTVTDVPDGGYRMLAGILAGQLDAAGARAAEESARAGRVWARTLTDAPAAPVTAQQATAHVVELMDRLGFEPSVPGPDGVVELHRCPFQQVAEQHSRVVCGVHLGLLQGALESLSAPVQATHLEPFVTPGLCLAHLAPADHIPTTAPPPPEGLPT